jgi:beta-lactamase class A
LTAGKAELVLSRMRIPVRPRHLLLPACALALLGAPAPYAAESPYEPAPPPLQAAPVATKPPPATPKPGPAALTRRLRSLGEAFQGKIGIAVEDVQDGWVAAYDGDVMSPQQSVSKLWVALTVFDAVDRGVIHLDDPVVVRREDMSVFYQPIQEHLAYGPYNTTVETLLNYQIARSDNAANDILDRLVGGEAAVEKVIADRGQGAIRAGPEERVLQARTAAVDWRPEYSFGRAFWTARDAVPMGTRIAALEAYLADPEDGATPVAMVDGLARLKRGELLSPTSTAKFLEIMASTETGPKRLKSGLPEEWTIAHKTGTGQDLADLGTGYNDVGLITAPDGRVYAVAAMIASTRETIPVRQAIMGDVVRAVVAVHDGIAPATLPLAQAEPAAPEPVKAVKFNRKARSARPRRHRQIAS